MNKKKVIIITVLVVILGIFLLYKYHFYRKYKMDTMYMSFYFKEPINIKTSSVKNPANFEGLYYKDVFKGFKQENGSKEYIKKDKKNEPIASYTIDVFPLFINSLSEEAFSFSTQMDISDYYSEKNMIKYLDAHNIKTDLDLLKYIHEKFPFRNSILTPVKTMRNNYLLYAFINLALSNIRAITPIEGDLFGYIVEYRGSTNKDIHIIHNNKQYSINLAGDEIANLEFVKSLLETISFNDTK